MEIGDKLKEARIKAGKSQEQIADCLLVSRQTISNWETGKFLPDIISIIKLSDLYQISLDEMIKGDEQIMQKIEKDTDIIKSNEKVMTLVWVAVVLSFAFSLWNYEGNNSALQFVCSAAPFVLIGIALIFLYTANKKYEKK